ncbi:MAG: hypothetical protein PHO46_08690 [Thermoguttaceae bacterium]|jgi:hypothetical protein|nr:hypothetical protein [Thermoguttaceae bacterium]
MNQEVNVLAIVKGKERYVFMYNAENYDAVIETFARYASDPELSFSWYDAAVLTQRIHKELHQSEIAAARAANNATLREDCIRNAVLHKMIESAFGDVQD